MPENPSIDQEEDFFDSLLDYLGKSRGFDFTQFKKNTLKRRILKQMSHREVDNFEDYKNYLEANPDEFQSLFNTILINVTAFFRDSNAWTYLREELLPKMLSEKKETDPIRCWCAGCASGEEAYTIAIILAEILGIEAFQQRVKIYATDVDEDALVEARQARYTAKQLEVIPSELRMKYFVAINDREFAFRSDLRRLVVFGRHNLFKDAPISTVDLLSCRNTLMYFNQNAQNFILKRFHFALNPKGILFLGKAEMLLTYGELFVTTNSQFRIFQRVSTGIERRRSPAFFQSYLSEDKVVNHHLQLQELAFESTLNAQLIVDQYGDLVRINQSAHNLFNLPIHDVVRPFNQLEIYHQLPELETLMDQVYREKSILKIKDIFYKIKNGTEKYLDIQINPLAQMDQILMGVNITITDVTESWELRHQVEITNQELQKTNGILQSTNQELEMTNVKLQTTNEELEIANVKLQATNEELETTNEELQSTNEELETINEELQSTNNELQSVNEEVRLRKQEYNRANDFLNAILISLRGAIIVINRESKILAWSHNSEEMWGLRAEEVQDKSLFGLDFGLPLDQIVEPIRKCLNDDENRQDFVLSAINRRGKKFDCRLSIDTLWNINKEKFGVIMIMEEVTN